MLYSAPFVAATVSAVRREIGRCSSSAGLDAARSDEFVVAVGEILANAVIHGGGSGEVVVCLEAGYVRCVVNDRGAGMPEGYGRPQYPDPTAEGGRGLWLAQMLCSRLMLDSSPRGTRIELCMDIP